MPNKKISELNNNSHPSGENLLPIVASGETKNISLSGLSNFISEGFSGGKKFIKENDVVIIKSGFQYLVYGDLVLQGGIIDN